MHGTLKGTQEGLENLPRYYGSEARESGRVTGVGSGFVEGGRVCARSLAIYQFY